MDIITQDVHPYPQHLLDLLTAEGFEAQFWQLYHTQCWKSYEACYEELETRREAYFGRRYYGEYDYFRKSIANRRKRRRGA